jgi:signal transduction histidine kinase
LRIAEIETERKKSQFKEHDIETMLDDVVDLYMPVIEAKNIDLEVHVDLQINTFTCDKNLLFQAFANVIDNALKFTLEYGEIEIALFTTEVLKSKEKPEGMFKVTDTIDATQNTLIFTVFDTGIGVTKADIEKLTQRFYRAEKSRTTKGNGLGLSLVAAVAELHEGKVNFVSDPLRRGHGLGCIIALPL